MKKVLEFSVYFTVFYSQEELKSELFRLETLYKKFIFCPIFSIKKDMQDKADQPLIDIETSKN